MPPTLAVLTANSQLGRAVVPVFAGAGWRVHPLTHDDVEVTDAASVERALGALDPAPGVFLNTAFSFSEEVETALRVNALGPRLLAGWCRDRGALLVHLSTDYVFSGETTEPYRETDPAEPRSAYGISKLAGELLVRSALPEHLIVRVSSLYGAGGSRAKGGTNFVSDMLAMRAAGKPLRVVTDQFHSPTYAPDAARTILGLVERGARGVVHVSNAGVCSKHDFAVRIFELAGIEAEVTPIRLADLPPGPAGTHRPRYTALAHERLHALGLAPRRWEDGLAEYLAETGELRRPPAER